MALAATVARCLALGRGCLPTDQRSAARRLARHCASRLALGLTNLAGVRLPTRDSVRAIDVEIDRLRRAGASFAKVEACEHWRNTSIDFLFIDNKLRQARQDGRRTTSLRIGRVRALTLCLLAWAAASLRRA